MMQKAPPPGPARNNQRQTFRQEVEVPIEMTVTGYPVTVHGTLMDISAEGCRVRSLIALEKDSRVKFEMTTAGKPIECRGRIAARKKLVGRAFYEYGIAFDKISTADSDRLVSAIMEFQRRAAVDRSQEREHAADLKSAPGQKRGAFRAMVAFPVKYRREGRPGTTTATANDLSAGGLKLICNEPFPKDVILTLEFTLPQEVLTVFSNAPVTDPSPFGPRGEIRPKPKDPRRPFEPMAIKAKVAARFKDSSGRVVLGVQFLDADAYTREEIQRYIHAAQLYKIRTNIDNT